MTELLIQFCTSADGTRIAYGTAGEGKPLVVVPGWGHSIELDWKHPTGREFFGSLSERRLVVGMDRRGVAASQREIDDISIEAQVADLAAVADAVGQDQFDLFGSLDGAALASVYAAQNPERISRLVLWTPFARGRGQDSPAWRSLVELIRSNWRIARRAMADAVFPSGPTELQVWWSDLLRESMSAEIAARYMEFARSLDVRSYLPKIRTPTLVLHPAGYRDVPVSVGRMVASAIPDSRLLEIDGDSGHPFCYDNSHVQRMLAFLDEGREGDDTSVASRKLPHGTAIILFADIVDSTALTERIGDAAFRDKARDLDGALRDVIRECGGTPVEGKLLGDGVLAVFTSARQAIEAALRFGKAAESVGLGLHVGIHAGDVIEEDGNVFGGAVNIAARVAAESAPGEVLVSQTVRDLARTSAGVAFEDAGERTLKGVSDAVRIWRVHQA